MSDPEMMQTITQGEGFIAALDQSGGSTPKALKGFGIGEDAYANEDEMFALIHQMRQRVITAPSFATGKVIGAILFEKTMDGEADGKPVPTALWERGVVPFLKVDKGLEDEADGVQMMKPMPGLDALLERAVAKGIFGTKMRSVIAKASPTGIAANVTQQFKVANQIIDHGLMPIVEPEVSLTSPERAEADAILKEELIKALDALPEDRQVMLKLSIPAKAGLYDDIVGHPRVARLVALSGGYSRDDACAELARNHGMIASFSRALLQDLRHGMDDTEFDAALGSAIDQIHRASTVKV
ncbi:fructose bisphosphate aldolase [Parasphingopyxis lamellibrachiae]|uniref:fructose-bisphosphate aldolase n=1 Tax=Parasphingopyxis lamellibrachiae TaxID=680125 RepID=A0A3D9FE82_9SPHN|nr:fructose bisphosphate aldolase [Parasphingopyxis lamellibrachiae]RED15356.1 fructose-bisphosphate aldolase [Parasphingopyxis lamellibrachiae]